MDLDIIRTHINPVLREVYLEHYLPATPRRTSSLGKRRSAMLDQALEKEVSDIKKLLDRLDGEVFYKGRI
ncbi:MAG: hypothetical protein GWN00_06080 [Aliifodinibius sp.]|nr:hypothetical protein [Fodinibius sp.]NIV15766.1 hypothetical protein [Fodinibius sp.]NIY24387.1 hypothetical protein [Fodinibius sp.]